MRLTDVSRREFLRSGAQLGALGAMHSMLPAVLPVVFPYQELRAAQLAHTGQADWPRFGCDLRNSRFNAGETTLGRSNVERLKAKWSFETQDGWPIQMTPAVVGDTLFFGAGRYQYALETAGGKLKWRFDWGANGEWESTAWNMNARYRNVRSSPQYENGRLYFGTGSCSVFCLDAATGRQVWKTPLLTPERAEQMSANIYYSPVVHAGKVYIAHSGGDASIFCLDAETGAIRWKFRVAQDAPAEWDTGGGSPWTSGAIDSERGVLYNGTGNNKILMPNLGLYTESLVAHDLDTGELLWYDQVHPQDAFDLDFNAHPMIFDAEAPGRIRGGVRPCVAAGNKAGIYCWNRYSGEFYWKAMLGERCTTCAAENQCHGGGLQPDLCAVCVARQRKALLSDGGLARLQRRRAVVGAQSGPSLFSDRRGQSGALSRISRRQARSLGRRQWTDALGIHFAERVSRRNGRRQWRVVFEQRRSQRIPGAARAVQLFRLLLYGGRPVSNGPNPTFRKAATDRHR